MVKRPCRECGAHYGYFSGVTHKDGCQTAILEELDFAPEAVKCELCENRDARMIMASYCHVCELTSMYTPLCSPCRIAVIVHVQTGGVGACDHCGHTIHAVQQQPLG
jgi:hypothetical protein